MFKNFSWRIATRRALEVFLGVLLGGGGMYLSQQSSDDPSMDPVTVVTSISHESLS